MFATSRYLTTKEWKESYGGHKDDSSTRIQRAVFKRLPFTHCALSFLPFEDPVCTPEGTIFDIAHITPYLKKHGINPVTGKKMSAKDLIVLKFSRDSDGKPFSVMLIVTSVFRQLPVPGYLPHLHSDQRDRHHPAHRERLLHGGDRGAQPEAQPPQGPARRHALPAQGHHRPA
ncbi:peptidyl-prolyl cis-trans isomerase, partial [Aphelenchoides avenae]